MQTVQKTEIRKVQFLEWDTPVVVQRQAQMVQTVQSGGVAGAVPARLWTSSQLGALDDEEFFVIEGWGVALTR